MKAVVAAVEAALVAHGRGAVAPGPGSDDPRVIELALAASAAVASRFFAVGTPRSIGLVGCGEAGRLALAGQRVFYAPRELRCADADPAVAARLAADEGGRAVPVAEACACDIVCVTATGVRIEREWVRRGTHLNVWPDVDLDERLLSFTKIAVITGPVLSHMWGTLGEVAAGLKDGRDLDEVSVFMAGRLSHIEGAVAGVRPDEHAPRHDPPA